MSNLLGNLAAAWGHGDGDEPNPEHFPGLLSLSESHLESGVNEFRTLLHHFEHMRQRILVAQNNLETMTASAAELPAEFQEVVVDNKEAFKNVADILEQILHLEATDEADLYWEALGELEECSENLKAANIELAQLARPQ